MSIPSIRNHCQAIARTAQDLDALLADAFYHCVDDDNLRPKERVWMLRRRTEAMTSIEPEFSPPWESVIG